MNPFGQERRVPFKPDFTTGPRAELCSVKAPVECTSGPCWAYVAYVEPMLDLCRALGGHVGALLSLCWAKHGVFIWALALRPR